MYLILFHKGSSFPNYIYDNLYQSVQLTHSSIFLITNSIFFDEVRSKLSNMNINTSNVFLISIEFLDSLNDPLLLQFNNLSSKSNKTEFWINTTSRFFYINLLMKHFSLPFCFHIENDVLLYRDLGDIYSLLRKYSMDNDILALQDSPTRAICSFIYFPQGNAIVHFLEFILSNYNLYNNDMELLGHYKKKGQLPVSPSDFLADTLGIFDACCIGQYLGGIDFKNIPQHLIKSSFVNPTIGFINETSSFKPNSCVFGTSLKDDIDVKYFLEQKNHGIFPINNLHIHSKQLYLFSSFFNISYNNIITGDSVLQLSDFVLLDEKEFLMHKNIHDFAPSNKLLKIRDKNNINISAFSKFINSINGEYVKLFIYTDLLNLFKHCILPYAKITKKLILYIHNGDLEFNDYDILQHPLIHKVIAQNCNIVHPKASLLPIGLARHFYPHGDKDTLYKHMISSYYNKKQDGVYCNINPNTHPFRQIILNTISSKFPMSNGKDYKMYIEELSSFYFALCPFGNGLDTHRFWETLYTGGIPIIINDPNKVTDSFFKNLESLHVPFLIYSLEEFSSLSPSHFNYSLYTNTLNKFQINSIFNIRSLTLSYYN